MPRRREAAQPLITHGKPRPSLIVGLIITLAGYGGVSHYQYDREQSARDRNEDAMTRRIEALENRLLSCGQRSNHG